MYIVYKSAGKWYYTFLYITEHKMELFKENLVKSLGDIRGIDDYIHISEYEDNKKILIWMKNNYIEDLYIKLKCSEVYTKTCKNCKKTCKSKYVTYCNKFEDKNKNDIIVSNNIKTETEFWQI